MYMPTTFIYPDLDPIESRRLTEHRPASRMEIARRVLRAQRDEVITGQVAAEEAPARFARQATPVRRVRLGISRALSAAADRIAPEAA